MFSYHATMLYAFILVEQLATGMTLQDNMFFFRRTSSFPTTKNGKCNPKP